MRELLSDGGVGLLVTVAWKGSIMLALAALASVLVPRTSAAGRHWIWFMAICGLLALPLAEAVAPRWDVAIPAGWIATSTSPADETPIAPLPLSPQGDATTPAQPRPTTAGLAPSPAATPGASEPTSARAGRIEAAASPSSTKTIPLLLLVWAGGAAWLLFSLGASWNAVSRIERTSGRFLGASGLEALTRGLAARLGIRKPVRLLRGAPDAMPMSWGILEPVVLLPEGAESWQRHRLVAVLLHELAHVRRRDCLTQFVAEIALALHWFNPLAWLAARRLRVEREHACDDLVLNSGARASDYALELLSLAQELRASGATALAAVAMARPVHLGPRLKALFDERSRAKLRLRSTALTAAFTAATLLVLAAFTPTAALTPVPRGLADPAAPSSPGEMPDEPGMHAPSLGSPTGSRGALAAMDAVVRGSLQAMTCGLAPDGWRRMSHQSDDDAHQITWSRPGCEVDVRVEGDIEFSADFRDVARLGRNGLLRIEEEDGNTERRLDVQPGAGGEVTYEYRVEGRATDFDAEARVWYEAMLLQVFRRGGFMAEERVAAILRSGGVGAVLQELDALTSDHVFAAYAEALLEQADLSDAEATGLVDRAREAVDSDHYLAGILEAMADRHLDSPAVLDAFLDASRTIASDHSRAGVLGRALPARDLSGSQVSSLLGSASEIASDHYLAELLRGVGSRYVLEPDLRSAYLRAVESIESDHYRSEVLSALLQRSELSPEELVVVLRAAGGISSDHYQSEILRQVARGGSASAEVRRAAIELTSEIGSDHYRSEVLSAFLVDGDIAEGELRDLISAANRIASDHYKAGVLTEIARGSRLQGEVRELFLDAVQGIRSSHYRGQVADVLLREGRGGR